MTSQFVCWDTIYKNEEGTVCTATWLDCNSWLRNKHIWKRVAFFHLNEGTTIQCMYSQLFKPDDALLLCNEIENVDETLFDNVESGTLWRYYDAEGNEVTADDDYETEEACDIYQYYLIDEWVANSLQRHTDEIILYSEMLNLYVLGVTHFGTAWNGVNAEYVV